MSRSFKAYLFLFVVIIAAGAVLWSRYRPVGYRYDFAITSRTVAADGPARELRWTGYGLERRQEFLSFKWWDDAMEITSASDIPPVDSAGGFTSLRRHNTHEWLGEGGIIAGHETRIFRYVDYDTLFVTDSGGRRMAHANRVVTDYYIADDVRQTGRQFARYADSINLVLAGLRGHQARERARGRENRYSGVPLRIVSQVAWVDALGRTRTTTTDSRVTTFERMPVSSNMIRELSAKTEEARVAARRNGWEYEFRIQTAGGDAKGEAPVTGKAEVIGEQMRITLEPREGDRRDRDRRGEYLLVSDKGRHIAMVRPGKREYSVVSADSLARLVSVGLNAVSRFVDIKVAGLQVDATRLGPGEPIAGYSTEKYRMSQEYRIDMRVFGARPTLQGRLTTDFWVSPELAVPGNPFFDFFALLPNALALQSPDYVRTSLAERGKMFETLPLKTVATLETIDQEGQKSTSVSTIEVTSLHKAALSPTRFEIPSSYKSTKGAANVF